MTLEGYRLVRSQSKKGCLVNKMTINTKIKKNLFKYLIAFITLTTLFFLPSTNAFSLPINFARPMEPLKYAEIKSEDFIIYHDYNAKQEAIGLLKSLQAAKPHLEKWLGVKREGYLPVIVSATTANASFANFLTDAIELQTMGQGGRDLAFHELVHSTMYRHMDNILGPAGSILHLPWMPAWWIEGLAEALSGSLGSAEQAAIERWYAINDSWPSYARLHSLYKEGSFAREGYGVAGAFVSYILRTYNPEKLKQFHIDFTDLSKPYMWPLTIIPFYDFMPMDRALLAFTGKTGEELYREYKKKAREHWQFLQTKKHLVFWDTEKTARKLGNLSSLRNLDGRLFSMAVNDAGNLFEYELKHDGENRSGLKVDARRLRLPSRKLHYARAISKKTSVFVTSKWTDDRTAIYKIHVGRKAKRLPRTFYRTKSEISHIFTDDRNVFWLERFGDTQRFCYKPIGKRKAKKCPLTATQPYSLAYLGQKAPNLQTKFIYFRNTAETLGGDKHRLLEFNTTSFKQRTLPLLQGGKPLSLSFLQGKMHLLLSGKSGFYLRRLSLAGSCEDGFDVPVAARRLYNVGGRLFIAIKTPSTYKLIPASSLPAAPCSHLSGDISPLLYAHIKEEASLKEAIAFASIWQPEKAHVNELYSEKMHKLPPTHLDRVAGIPTPLQAKDAKWRGRTLFVFPWIGADGEGNTFGIRSVPYMDEMQNETIHLNALYGVQSRFPDIGLMFESNRYKTHYSVHMFNRQTYNGSFGANLLYYKETGSEVAFSRYFPVSDVTLSYGSKVAYFKPIIGPSLFRIEGYETSFQASVSKSVRFLGMRLSSSLSGFAVPPKINDVWTYNKLSASTSLAIPINLFNLRYSTFQLGLAGSRTRGKKMKYLKELYRPLKTFVPGSGGGLNGANFPILGEGYLTGARTGDTQGNAKVTWTFPIVPQLDKLLGIFYMERLDFTAFFTYGGAWQEGDGLSEDVLVAAHGYNVDLSTDIKGITVNVGLGTGQVLGHDFEVYFKFGFDTLIDIE